MLEEAGARVPAVAETALAAEEPSFCTDRLTCGGFPLDRELAGFSSSLGGGLSWWDDNTQSSDATTMPRDELAKVWPMIFDKLDFDKNGKITKEEISAAAGDLYAPIVDLLKTADTNQDGIVTRKEWSKMYEQMITKHGDPSPATADTLRTFVNSRAADKDDFGGFN
jgi:hypothetical protein